MQINNLFALVLAGGQSQRMGFDKGMIIYRQLSSLQQRLHHLETLQGLGLKTFLSCRNEQLNSLETQKYDFIPDRFELEGGPGCGILSAHLTYPEASWLVLAVDFPFADNNAIDELIKAWLKNKTSVAYINQKNIIEPLFAIWEPELLQLFLKLFKDGNKGPAYACKEYGVSTILPANPKALVNINTPFEAQKYLELQNINNNCI